jgi:hypothetical protein
MFIVINYAGDIRQDALGNAKVFATKELAQAEIDGIIGRVGYNLSHWYIKAA